MHDSTHEYDENCPGCQPSVMDTKTGEVWPPDHPIMVKIHAEWKKVPLDQKRAWHRVAMNQSPSKEDKRIFVLVSKRLAEATK